MEWFVEGREVLLWSNQRLFSMDGGELFNRIRQRHERPYTEREAAQIILMIAKAVAHLHHMDMVSASMTHVFVSFWLFSRSI